MAMRPSTVMRAVSSWRQSAAQRSLAMQGTFANILNILHAAHICTFQYMLYNCYITLWCFMLMCTVCKLESKLEDCSKLWDLHVSSICFALRPSCSLCGQRPQLCQCADLNTQNMSEVKSRNSMNSYEFSQMLSWVADSFLQPFHWRGLHLQMHSMVLPLWFIWQVQL